jgi:hypothetical protein
MHVNSSQTNPQWLPSRKAWKIYGAVVALILGPFAFLWRGLTDQDLHVQIRTYVIDIRSRKQGSWLGGTVWRSNKPRKSTLLRPIILSSKGTFTSHDGKVHPSYSRYMEFGKVIIISSFSVVPDHNSSRGDVRVRLFTPWPSHPPRHNRIFGTVETMLGPFGVEVSRCSFPEVGRYD